MGLFGNPRKNKEEWAAVLPISLEPEIELEVDFLDMVTTQYLQQETNILYDSIRLVLTSKYSVTRETRYKLAQESYANLVKIKKYANREQKVVIKQAMHDFMKMESAYKLYRL